jgi:hypothetical protein
MSKKNNSLSSISHLDTYIYDYNMIMDLLIIIISNHHFIVIVSIDILLSLMIYMV